MAEGFQWLLTRHKKMSHFDNENLTEELSPPPGSPLEHMKKNL